MCDPVEWRISTAMDSYVISSINYTDSYRYDISAPIWFFSTTTADYPDGNWRIEDRIVGDSSNYATGTQASFMNWLPPQGSILFKLSQTRWNHDLY